jgi:DNA repair protein RecN (Recombination protein N)
VVVVTHLPQVAAFADTHLVVHKDARADGTTTAVRRVDGAARVEELARMLSGLPESATGRGHAEELLESAAEAKRLADSRAG